MSMSRESKNRPPKLPEPSKNSTPTATTQIQHASFSGPIPPPTVLEGYDRIIPGAAERILVMAEADAKHQQEIELAALEAADREVRRGQIFGFTIGVLALVSSVIALHGIAYSRWNHRRHDGCWSCICFHHRSRHQAI